MVQGRALSASTIKKHYVSYAKGHSTPLPQKLFNCFVYRVAIKVLKDLMQAKKKKWL